MLKLKTILLTSIVAFGLFAQVSFAQTITTGNTTRTVANHEDAPIKVNGFEIQKNSSFPILNINNEVYIPMHKLSQILGATFRTSMIVGNPSDRTTIVRSIFINTATKTDKVSPNYFIQPKGTPFYPKLAQSKDNTELLLNTNSNIFNANKRDANVALYVNNVRLTTKVFILSNDVNKVRNYYIPLKTIANALESAVTIEDKTINITNKVIYFEENILYNDKF